MKTLFVGLGSIGSRHLRSCRRIRPAVRNAAWRRNGSASAEDVTIFQDAQSIASFQPALVWICSPTYVHASQLDELIKHLPATTAYFVEKPLAHTVKDVRSIQNQLTQLGSPFFYGCILRFHPLVQRVRELLSSGAIGLPLRYELSCGSDLSQWRPGQDYRTSYSADPDRGGGVHLDLIHEFDYATHWFGPFKSLGGIVDRRSNLEIQSADYCDANAIHENGLQGRIQLDYFSKDPRRDIRIEGDRATLTASLLTGEIRWDSHHETHLIDRDELHDRQTRMIFECLENGLESPWKIDAVAQLNEQVIRLGSPQ